MTIDTPRVPEAGLVHRPASSGTNDNPSKSRVYLVSYRRKLIIREYEVP